MKAGTVTALIVRWKQGDREAEKELLDHIYDKLRALATRAFAGEAPPHTLSPTVLIHDAFGRLARSQALSVANRAEFYRLASRTMYRLLVEHARLRRNRKARERDFVFISSAAGERSLAPEQLLAIHRALEELRAVSPRRAEVVVMKFFGGQSLDEIAEALGTSRETVKRDWRFARAWLGQHLGAVR